MFGGVFCRTPQNSYNCIYCMLNCVAISISVIGQCLYSSEPTAWRAAVLSNYYHGCSVYRSSKCSVEFRCISQWQQKIHNVGKSMDYISFNILLWEVQILYPFRVFFFSCFPIIIFKYFLHLFFCLFYWFVFFYFCKDFSLILKISLLFQIDSGFNIYCLFIFMVFRVSFFLLLPLFINFPPEESNQ